MKKFSLAPIAAAFVLIALTGCKQESTEQKNAKEFKPEQGGQVVFDPAQKTPVAAPAAPSDTKLVQPAPASTVQKNAQQFKPEQGGQVLFGTPPKEDKKK